MRNEHALNERSTIYRGDILTITEQSFAPFIFQDIFRYVDIDLSRAKGTDKLLCNGDKTIFYVPINDSDVLETIWA